MYDYETTELIKIFQLFGKFRNSLSEKNNVFTKTQLAKKYDIVTKTFKLGGKLYTGTFREDSHRKENKEAYEKESKFATVLASFGFDVILIEENNTIPGKKPDAIVNGIVMDFKEISAFTEQEASRNTLGNNYKDGMRKSMCKGVAMYLHDFSNAFVRNNMGFEKTKQKNNGLALFFHEDTGLLQLIDMEKVRAVHFEQLSGRAPETNSEPPDNSTITHTVKKSRDSKTDVYYDNKNQAYVKCLFDEVFGETFINSFVYKKNSSGKTEKDKFTVNTEYVLFYAKSEEYILNDVYKPLATSTIAMYSKDDNDGRGKYQTVSLQKPASPGPETSYDYVDNNGKVWKCPPKGWRMIYSKIKELENDNRLVLTGNTLRVKDYWNERPSEGKRIDTLWDDLPENTAGMELSIIVQS